MTINVIAGPFTENFSRKEFMVRLVDFYRTFVTARFNLGEAVRAADKIRSKVQRLSPDGYCCRKKASLCGCWSG